MESEELKEEIEAFEKNPLQNLTLQDAIITIVVCGARIRAEDCSEDIARIAEIVQAHTLFTEDRKDTVRRINRIVNMMQASDCTEAASIAAGVLNQDLKKLALRWAAEVAGKEGSLSKEQMRNLDALADPLSLDRKTVDAIYEVFT